MIELLAVLAIVAVLAGIVTTSVSGTGDKSRDAQVAQDAGSVFTAANEYFADQDGVATITTATQLVLGTTPSPAQTTSAVWPEASFGAGNSYAEEFPVDAIGTVADVVLLQDDGSSAFVATLADFLAGYTAIDFDTLIADGYMTVAPDSFDTVFNGVNSQQFNTYLWVFRKSDSSGVATGANDTRNVLVFKLISAAESGTSPVLTTLTYAQIK